MKIMSEKEEKCNSTLAKFESIGSPKAASRFRAYRLVAEQRERKLKENEMLIDRLKDEINFSREVEKNLTSHICSVQDRLNGLQNSLKNFINVSERQRQNEQISQKIEQTLEELCEKINQARQESRDLYQRVSKEADLLKKIKELEAALEGKNCECDLMKMEIEALCKEKENMETRFQGSLRNLENELEKLIGKEAEAQTHCRETRLYYQQQIQDYEQKIAAYESERKSYLEDFEPPKASDSFICSGNSTTKAEERPTSRSGKRRQSLENSDRHPSQLPKKGKDKSFVAMPTKQKPQLEFLTPDDSSRTVNPGKKRRLFSTNCNHYLD